jgi:hypothetical protein
MMKQSINKLRLGWLVGCLCLVSFVAGAQDVPRSQETQVAVKETKVLICQSKYAKVYHKYRCRGLKRCRHRVIKTTLKKAKTYRRACRICYRVRR